MDPTIFIGPIIGGFVTLLLWIQTRSANKIESGFSKMDKGFETINHRLNTVDDKIELVDKKVSNLRDEVHTNYVDRSLLGLIMSESDRREERRSRQRRWERSNTDHLNPKSRGNITRVETHGEEETSWDELLNNGPPFGPPPPESRDPE